MTSTRSLQPQECLRAILAKRLSIIAGWLNGFVLVDRLCLPPNIGSEPSSAKMPDVRPVEAEENLYRRGALNDSAFRFPCCVGFGYFPCAADCDHACGTFRAARMVALSFWQRQSGRGPCPVRCICNTRLSSPCSRDEAPGRVPPPSAPARSFFSIVLLPLPYPPALRRTADS